MKQGLCEVLSWQVKSFQKEGESSPTSEATVKIRVKGKTEHASSNGTGPVDALLNAVKKALARFYPEAEKILLTEYSVSSLNGHFGSEAKVRVTIKNRLSYKNVTTSKVSTDILEASLRADLEGAVMLLLKGERK